MEEIVQAIMAGIVLVAFIVGFTIYEMDTSDKKHELKLIELQHTPGD